jgi:hypothetical protein
VFENVLRRIFGRMTAEVIGDCRRLSSEELHILYSSRSIIMTKCSEEERLTLLVECMVKVLNVYSILVEEL